MDLIRERLVATARDLLGQGLSVGEAEARIFIGLVTTPGPDLPARRAQLFRAAVGLSAPLSRDEASRLTDALGRPLRGDPDRGFSRRFVLAHVRGRLAQAAHDAAEGLRRDHIEVTPANLEMALMMTITKARPGCELILRNPAIGCSIEQMIEIATTDYFSAVVGLSVDDDEPRFSSPS